ncbi:hypothetical protein [Shouchella clausii]|uniref:hypothetical protein n=1 Tax=Shouchella clausii TaxID=79880 RepID=UPI000BA55294|nr:hypothetical protein [Shouchella clausii]PAE96746.1 hypothetical protein CHH71_12105 [Shouchella clausii]
MKTKALKGMNSAEIQVIKETLERQCRVKSKEQIFFPMVLEKVKQHGPNVELDGMEMKLICFALRRKALILTAVYGMDAQQQQKKVLYNLAFEISKQRIQFQQSNNPVKKEAQTAVTVHASALNL